MMLYLSLGETQITVYLLCHVSVQISQCVFSSCSSALDYLQSK